MSKAIKTWKAINPRGNLAKEMEIGLRRAIWLMRLCELWLLWNDSDHRIAATSRPFVPPPNHWDDDLAKMLKKAIKGSELWEKGPVPKSKFRLLESGPKVYPAPPMNPTYGRRAPWSLYYEHWRSGSLGRGILTGMKSLPRENRNRLKALIDETEL